LRLLARCPLDRGVLVMLPNNSPNRAGCRAGEERSDGR